MNLRRRDRRRKRLLLEVDPFKGVKKGTGVGGVQHYSITSNHKGGLSTCLTYSKLFVKRFTIQHRNGRYHLTIMYLP